MFTNLTVSVDGCEAGLSWLIKLIKLSDTRVMRPTLLNATLRAPAVVPIVKIIYIFF